VQYYLIDESKEHIFKSIISLLTFFDSNSMLRTAYRFKHQNKPIKFLNMLVFCLKWNDLTLKVILQ
jgi:hypothetical protein